MIKYLLIIFNSFILFLYGLYSGDNGLSVTSTIPAVMVGGKEVPITITVNKGGMSGFAKLQLELPPEFEVKEADELDATYTYNEGIAKWVWSALPTESEMTIHLVVVPAGDNLGPKTITAKYSYVENNVKQVVEMVPAEVKVVTQTEADMLAAGQGGSNEEPETKEPETTVPTPTESPVAQGNPVEPPSDIKLIRLVNRISATDYEVSVLIIKGATKGFARYSDELPNDVSVKSTATDGASFSLADGKIKYVWVNVPQQDTLKISYVINSSRIQVVELKGEYSYLEDNQSKKQITGAESLAFETPVNAENQNPTEQPVVQQPSNPPGGAAQPSNPSTPAIAAQKQTKPAPKPKKTPAPKTETTSKVMSNASANSAGTVYQVQIGAFTSKKVTSTKLEKKFNVSEIITSEMTGGYTKFMVGNHTEYKSARDHREQMVSQNNIRTSFVVAYNNGKRITVQEALSITNQKWYK